MDFTGGISSPLQQGNHTTVHTGNSVISPHHCIQRVHEYHLFPCQGGGRRKHHLEIVFVALKLLASFRQCAPESVMSLSFHVSEMIRWRAFSRMGVKSRGGIEIRRSQDYLQ